MSPAELGAVLAAIPPVVDGDLLLGTAHNDDAAVYRFDERRAVVASVDFFTAIVDDPYAFGAIAAANSLSDVYAIGGRPRFALCLLCFPRQLIASGIFQGMVKGGAAKLAEAGVSVVGGHSIDDDEPKLGYVVIGEVDPARMVTHQGARPGDALYLTKPLGTGLITTAIKQGSCPSGVKEAAISLMCHLNRDASMAMVEVGATAATDVTGFGLIGHLLNLDLGADLDLGAVPLLPGVRELAEADLFPGGSRRNRLDSQSRVHWNGTSEVDQLILCDAQTSGGLLVAVPPERALDFERRLTGTRYPPARIGWVREGPVRVV